MCRHTERKNGDEKVFTFSPSDLEDSDSFSDIINFSCSIFLTSFNSKGEAFMYEQNAQETKVYYNMIMNVGLEHIH